MYETLVFSQQTQESHTEEPKQKAKLRIREEKPIEKVKKGDKQKETVYERYPLNPDYLNQIVVLGKNQLLTTNYVMPLMLF